MKEFLQRVFLRRWQDFFAAIVAFVTFNTRVFAHISDAGSLKARIELSTLFFFCIVALYFAPAWLISDVSYAEIESYVRATAKGLGWALLGLSPFAIAFALLKRRDSMLVLNIVIFQQMLGALVLALSLVIYAVPEPARSDFQRFEEGRGFGTVVYRNRCGLLDDNLEIAAMNRKALVRNRTILADLRTLQTWPSPKLFRSMQAWSAELTPAQRQEFLTQIDRRNAELSAVQADFMRILALSAKRERLASEFANSYPNVAWSIWVKVVGLLIVAAITTVHLIRSFFLQTGQKAARWFTFVILLSAWLGSGLMSFVIARTVGYQAPHAIQSLLNAERDIGGAGEDLGSYDRRIAEMERLQVQIEGEVRSDFLDYQTQCPDANDQDLWPNQR